MNEFKNIWILIKSGFLPKKKRNFKETILLGLKLYGILILLKAFCFGLSYFLDSYGIFEMPKHITGEKIKSYGPVSKILMIAIIAPIIEEFTYRIGLLFTKTNLTITIIGISYFTLKNISELERLYCILIAAGIGVVLYLSLNQKFVELFSNFWKMNKRKIFYGLLLIFGLSHIVNYELTTELLIFSPIVVLPHLVAGFIYSYARLNSGILLAICIHSFNNGIIPLVLLITE
ncbi:CPBP family intramembrane metalloprotease [Aquimarina sp. BL5]|uniref:CPBP family glutamic-type intramembrane protease n=1 Tax=Aquimarina sp. BL5 TaxID=1714860 RepID=UPI000E4EDF23|nr:CPBP family glutamic-type intramembrane protease [Aquimarina sp. BL5]AXT52910.1 CPBP family intramembrane metalloprotease [Aquimarina sp. BL5]RKM90830.1 CPBP family intramembrane metalloprotease [Aquimarina sp. BL5]